MEAITIDAPAGTRIDYMIYTSARHLGSQAYVHATSGTAWTRYVATWLRAFLHRACEEGSEHFTLELASAMASVFLLENERTKAYAYAYEGSCIDNERSRAYVGTRVRVEIIGGEGE